MESNVSDLSYEYKSFNAFYAVDYCVLLCVVCAPMDLQWGGLPGRDLPATLTAQMILRTVSVNNCLWTWQTMWQLMDSRTWAMSLSTLM